MAILNEMVGQPVIKHSFKRKTRAITFHSHAAVNVGDDKVQIDPLLLFQRLIISGYQANDLANALTYELCNYPPALFEAKDRLLKAVKSQLAAVIWSEVPLEPPPSQNFKYVHDGGPYSPSHSWATWRYVWQDTAGLRQLCDKALWSGSGHV